MRLLLTGLVLNISVVATAFAQTEKPNIRLTFGKHWLIVALCFSALVRVADAQTGNPMRQTLAEFGPDLDVIKAAGAKLYEDENVSIGTIEEWMNLETGGAGEVKLVEIFEHQEMQCRKLLHNARPGGGETKRFTVTRCKTADGSWKIL